jgi:hypothetical protein
MIVPEPDTHRVTQLMALCAALGLDRCDEIVCPADAGTGIAGRVPIPGEPYA